VVDDCSTDGVAGDEDDTVDRLRREMFEAGRDHADAISQVATREGAVIVDQRDGVWPRRGRRLDAVGEATVVPPSLGAVALGPIGRYV
jgi:hypothetical protein